MYQVDKEYRSPVVPNVGKPQVIQFLLKTWSGRIILLNTILYLIVASKSGALARPRVIDLIDFGANHSFLVVSGQYWRLITPAFLHGDLLHFLVNNWAIYVLGFQVESMLGSSRFLFLYLLAGLGGNICSSAWTMGLSVGASSSLFGLLGAGFYVETIYSRKVSSNGGKPGYRAYLAMIVMNLLLGTMIPVIDNAAHLGGLVTGLIFTYIIFNKSKNNLVKANIKKSRIATLVLVSLLILGFGFVSSRDIYVQRIKSALVPGISRDDQILYMSQVLSLSPNDDSVRFQRLELYVEYGNYTQAEIEFAILVKKKENRSQMRELIQRFSKKGNLAAVNFLSDLWQK